MPLVVLDSSVALRAILGNGDTVPRKLMVLAAAGAAEFRIDTLGADLDALASEADQTTSGSVNDPNLEIQRAEQQLAAIRSVVGDIPTDWALAGGAALFDEYESKALELAGRLGRGMSREVAQMIVRQVQSLTVVAPTPHYVLAPALTSDPDDDPIVYDALRVKADYIIAKDRHIVPDAECEIYEVGDLTVMAIDLDYFAAAFDHGLDLDSIDGSLLENVLTEMRGLLQPRTD